jgi:predicted deacylase
MRLGTRKRSAKAATKRASQSEQNRQPENLHELLGKPLQLMSMFLRVGRKLGMQEHWLTIPERENHAVLMLSLGEPSESSKLVIAGVHGDEPAGVMGLLSFLFCMIESPAWRRQAGSFALVPMMSPSAFELQTRTNLWNEDANRGYPVSGVPRVSTHQCVPSHEGRVLAHNLDALAPWVRKAVLALHEDCEQELFYLYAFHSKESAMPLALRLRDVGFSHFGIVADSENFEGSVVRDGIILNHVLHGALDELIFKKLGVPVVVTETPGLKPLQSRVKATEQILKAFLL